MADKDPKSPATTSLAYDAMIPAWDKIQTVLDGTQALREAGKRYLPQHKYEPDEVYGERLARSTLLNFTKLTLEDWVGRPFSDPIKFDKVPAALEEYLKDLDLLGNDVQTFCRDWFSDGLAMGLSHVLVDYPRLPSTGTVRTLADDNRDKLRPYCIHIRPGQLFFAEGSIEAGEEVLREIRLMEEVTVRDGFAEHKVKQIRRVFLEKGQGQVELYQFKRVKNSKREAWVVVDSYSYDLPIIPLVTFYAHRDGFMLSRPPLEDLVDLNLAHWQSCSDQRACLTVARFPLLALSGGSDAESKLKVGPNRWLYSADPSSKFYYVEHSGAAIGVGRNDLLDLQDQMSAYGAQFLKKQPGGTTATARALDSAEATSPLQDVTIRFGKALTRVLGLMALWMKAPEGGTATLTTDFGPEEVSLAELTTLQEARRTRDISRETFLKELMRRGLLADDYDIEEDALKLENEALDLFGTNTEGAPKSGGEPNAVSDGMGGQAGVAGGNDNLPPQQR